jgi:pimeloyl-ACP methyl ester carboxylesterase
MDEQQQQRMNEAAQEFADAVIASYKTVSDHSVEAQKRQVQLAQSFFVSTTDILRAQAEHTQTASQEPAEQQPQREQGADQDLAQTSVGSSIDYDVHGEGPPLLLITGLGFRRWSWFKQVPKLSQHLRVITFDIRNLDRPDSPDPNDHVHGVEDLAAHASALLDHLGIERAHVLGTSLGGFVAQELALRRPELVDQLVLVATSHGGPNSTPPSWEALRTMIGLGAEDRADAVRQGLETATSAAYRSDHPVESELVVRWRIADAPSQPAYLEQMMAGTRFDASRRVHGIRSPTLILHGDDDQVVPVDNAEALAQAIPDARRRIFEGAGHLVFIERADEVNEEILSFLEAKRHPSLKERLVAQPRRLLLMLRPLMRR